MHRLIVASLLVLSSGAHAMAAAEHPEKLVQQLYKNDAAIVVAGGHDDRLSRYFEKPLADLIRKDHQEPDDSNTLPFDPVFDSNGGMQTKSFRIHDVKVLPNKASVIVELTLVDDSRLHTIHYDLHKTKDGWKIANIATSDWDLKKLLTRLHGK